mmetsp:Transcript_13167/g.35463  ORF Transcript_13167/g.35463 Transcript_13167/m.35463 type:complete len:236 (+) Transcript_13167:402-1109(+)
MLEGFAVPRAIERIGCSGIPGTTRSSGLTAFLCVSLLSHSRPSGIPMDAAYCSSLWKGYGSVGTVSATAALFLRSLMMTCRKPRSESFRFARAALRIARSLSSAACRAAMREVLSRAPSPPQLPHPGSNAVPSFNGAICFAIEAGSSASAMASFSRRKSCSSRAPSPANASLTSMAFFSDAANFALFFDAAVEDRITEVTLGAATRTPGSTIASIVSSCSERGFFRADGGMGAIG